jgi:hypothetical protein
MVNRLALEKVLANSEIGIAAVACLVQRAHLLKRFVEDICRVKHHCKLVDVKHG